MTLSRSRRRRPRRSVLSLAGCLVALAPAAALGQEPPDAPETPASEEAGADEALEAELAAELAEMQAGQEPQPGAGDPTSTGTTASSRGLSNTFNPAISATGLGLVGWSSRDGDANDDAGQRDDLETGFSIQEVEVRLSAIVDPFFRADLTLAASADEIGFEEAYVTTLSLPRVTVRGGLIRAAFGRHNELHTHAFPFITAPLPWRELLGPEGLSDPGVSADVLLPLPFFTELQLQVFSGEWRPLEGGLPDDPATADDESVPDVRTREDFGYVAHLETLFELGDSTTLALGGSYLGGRNGFDGWTHAVGADMTLKWRPIEAERFTSVDWTTEYLWVDRRDAPTESPIGGAYTSLRYQFAQQWWLQGRGALLGLPDADASRTWRAEALAAFVPSEFSALRLQYAYETTEDADEDPIHEVFLQVVFSVGSHPAHAY